MATLSITIPDAQAPRVLDALSASVGWSPTLADGSANPETKAQAAKRAVIAHIMNEVRGRETSDAVTTAANKVNQEVTLS